MQAIAVAANLRGGSINIYTFPHSLNLPGLDFARNNYFSL